MDTVKELLEPIKARLNNSIIGSFTISWCIVNWKFLYVLVVSNIYAIGRVELAEMQLNHYVSFPLPVLMTIFYVLALPRIENWITKINKNIILQKEKDIILTETEILKEKTKLAKENTKLELASADLKEAEGFAEKSRTYEATISLLNKNIDDLKVELNLSINDNDELNRKLNGIKNNIAVLDIRYPGLKMDLENILDGKPISKISEDQKMAILERKIDEFNKILDSMDSSSKIELSEVLSKHLVNDSKLVFEAFKRMNKNQRDKFLNDIEKRGI